MRAGEPRRRVLRPESYRTEPGVLIQRGPTTGIIVPVADPYALSRKLIRDVLEGSGQAAEQLGSQQISW